MAQAISADPKNGDVEVHLDSQVVVVREVEGEFIVVSPPDLKPDDATAVIACHAAAIFLGRFRPKQFKLF